jgi:transcriptional regulator with XRE-family HTH domain
MNMAQQMVPDSTMLKQAEALDVSATLQAKLRQRIVDFLEVSGSSQSGFATDVGCSPSSLSSFLNGERAMTLEEVLYSAHAIGMTLGELDAPNGEKPISILVYLKKLEYLYQSDREMFQYFTGLIDTWLNLSKNYQPSAPGQT